MANSKADCRQFRWARRMSPDGRFVDKHESTRPAGMLQPRDRLRSGPQHVPGCSACESSRATEISPLPRPADTLFRGLTFFRLRRELAAVTHGASKITGRKVCDDTSFAWP
jgi:hypothetical protein